MKLNDNSEHFSLNCPVVDKTDFGNHEVHSQKSDVVSLLAPTSSTVALFKRALRI